MKVSFDDWGAIVAALQKRRVAAAVIVGSGLFFAAVFTVGDPLSERFKTLEWPQWVLLLVGAALCYSVGLLLVDALAWLGRSAATAVSDGSRAVGSTVKGIWERREIGRSAREQLRGTLIQLSPQQRRFLDLFAQASVTAASMNRELLPREVYAAGAELVRLGIVKLEGATRGQHATERYALAEETVPLLEEIVFQGPVGRREARLDLSRVQGTGSSGGGAPGGATFGR